ncbi:hypothetical protein JZ751_017769 [Albula glossodonta]|uniref:Uncharacterized protein n=1 Tax=Albula glossodonta TaxID=121402 RepID=A0A8T2PPC0_9TELE|nr:hypothetical protein JZ751_017769 [Albula glossodonta]
MRHRNPLDCGSISLLEFTPACLSSRRALLPHHGTCPPRSLYRLYSKVFSAIMGCLLSPYLVQGFGSDGTSLLVTLFVLRICGDGRFSGTGFDHPSIHSVETEEETHCPNKPRQTGRRQPRDVMTEGVGASGRVAVRTMGAQSKGLWEKARLEPQCLERPSGLSSSFCSAAKAISTSYQHQQ